MYYKICEDQLKHWNTIFVQIRNQWIQVSVNKFTIQMYMYVNACMDGLHTCTKYAGLLS
jgi:subtilase family serine protease